MEDDFKLIDIVRKLNGESILEKPPREPQEEYEVPARIRFFKNRIELYQRQMDDLCEERRQALKDVMKFNAKALTHSEQLNGRLGYVEARLKSTEAKLKETYQLLREEMKNL